MEHMVIIMETQTRKQRFKIGFTAGLAAGVIASAVMLFLSIEFGGLSLPEVFGSEMTALMPPTLFDYLHQLIGGDAKHYLFYGIFVGQCLVFAVSGGLFTLFMVREKHAAGASLPVASKRAGDIRLQPGETRLQPSHGLLLALILWLLTGFGLLPLTGSGIFGSQLSIGMGVSMISLAIVGLFFGFFYVAIQNWLFARTASTPASAGEAHTSSYDEKQGISRRTVLQRGLVLAGIGLLGVGAWQFITQGIGTGGASVAHLIQQYKSKIVPPPVPNYGTIQPVKNLSPEITSNDQFYIVSKNIVSDPTVAANSWQLTIDGMVEHPLTFTYEQVLALPMQSQYETLECISNDVGGQYMSNALWQGVRLQDVLLKAGVKPGARKIVFYAVDNYSDSIYLEKAMEPTTLLAVRMNGATLPQEHGFPIRMLVPGIYGMKHCKWLTRIQVTNDDYQGYWEQRGWSDLAGVRLTSRIDSPLQGVNAAANKLTYIAGVAFSGNKGISEVDVSLDGGTRWERATLKHPLSDLTWVLWEYPWRPTKQGNYTLVVRAIDLEGNVQDPRVAPPLPNGSSGYESFDISVI
jgi:DMSO/TMAO reductase YedYZ molybdopterin-dependent catalytic subunit